MRSQIAFLSAVIVSMALVSAGCNPPADDQPATPDTPAAGSDAQTPGTNGTPATPQPAANDPSAPDGGPAADGSTPLPGSNENSGPANPGPAGQSSTGSGDDAAAGNTDAAASADDDQVRPGRILSVFGKAVTDSLPSGGGNDGVGAPQGEADAPVFTPEP